MFWKKKDEGKKSLIKAVPDVRNAFRVSPLATEPVKFKFMGKTVNLIDISSGGVSFKNDGFKVNSVDEVAFILPRVPGEVRVKLEIVRIIEDRGICCCQFVDIEQQQEDAVARYVLERQKYDLQAKRMEKK